LPFVVASSLLATGHLHAALANQGIQPFVGARQQAVAGGLNSEKNRPTVICCAKIR
jgi:hypothetical protein